MATSPQNAAFNVTNVYNERFEKLLISLDEAIIDAGRKTVKQQLIESSEQNESRRLLLVVEELANKKKEVAANAEQAYLQGVEDDFHKQLIEDLKVEIEDTPMILDKVLKFDPSLGKLLDVLYTEACSISRLVTCLETLPWLEISILRYVRQPKFQRKDSTGQLIVLRTIRSALSFVGIESLRTLVPALIAKHALPTKSEYAPDLMKHQWIYTLGTGNVAKALAKKFDVRPEFAFNIGLFGNIGRTAIIHLYLRAFENKLRQEISKARKKNDLNHATALSTLEPSQAYMIKLVKHYANYLNTNIIKALNCKWLMIAIGFEDFLKIKELNIEHVNKLNLHPFAKLLFTAQGYMHYRMLAANKLIDKHAASAYLRNFGIDSNDLALISKINLTGIELNISGIVEETEQDSSN